jgi:prepilin-type N-terminal cleavage/methylation domain-containing protein
MGERIIMKTNKGFTLVELLVVMAIIAILAVVAVPRFAAVTDGAKRSAVTQNFNSLRGAASMYLAQYGKSAEEIKDLTPYMDTDLSAKVTPKGAVYTMTGSVLQASISLGTGGVALSIKLE